MKRTHLILPALIALGVSVSCAQDDLQQGDSGTGGTGVGATGGTSAAGGSAGSAAPGAGTGGTTGGTGGTTGGTGGSTGGTGGSTGGATTGGSAGTSTGATGGSVPMGGMSGSASSVGGGAGMPSVGGGAGMMSAGGSGGDAAGGSAGTGTAGTGTAGTGGEVLDPAVIVPDVDGFKWEGTCTGTESGHNCAITTNTCPNGGTFYQKGVTLTKSVKVHGTPGVKYTLNIEVRGVAGGRCYTGGTPGTMDGADLDGANNNGWYTGGAQKDDSIWNTYEIHVENPAVDGAANVYFANSVQPVANPDAFPSGTGNNCQMEMTIAYGYMASFPVMGDSTIRFDIHDANCKGQQNCGKTAQDATCMPRTISLAGMTPTPTFTQPVTNTVGTNNLYPQWLLFDVKSITSP